MSVQHTTMYSIVQPDFGLWCGQFFEVVLGVFFLLQSLNFQRTFIYLFTVWLINQALKFRYFLFKHSFGLWLSPHTILKTFLIDSVCCGLMHCSQVLKYDVLTFRYADSGQAIHFDVTTFHCVLKFFSSELLVCVIFLSFDLSHWTTTFHKFSITSI